MNLSNLKKKQIITSLIETISQAADKEYQKRVWIKGEGPECGDYDDFVDIVLHENGAIIEEYKNFNISDYQFKLLKNFQTNLSTFSCGIGRQYQPQDFIDTKEWNEIVKMAKELVKAFN